jgi:tetratricopeptide (TPR) repeat protein
VGSRGKARQRVGNTNIQVVPTPQHTPAAPPEPSAPDLESLLSAYREALEDLPSAPGDTAAARVLRALLARDRLAEAMSSAGASLPAESLTRLVALDERLKSSAGVLEGAVGSEVLAGWRETRRPPADAWWWLLDERVAAHLQEGGFGARLLGGLLVAVAVSLATDISQRFLSGGPDLLGVVSILSQATLALLAASAFTGFENAWVDGLLARLAVRPAQRSRWKLQVALAFFGLVLLFRLSLPLLAGLYDWWGQERFEQRHDYPGALDHFRRAIALDPSFAQAHFHLAEVSEELHDDEQALREYEVALREYASDGRSDALPTLYNNLARLHLRKGNHGAALELLEEAFQKHEQGVGDAGFAYAIHKNRGQARLGLGLYLHATDDLKRALELRPRASAAHCLLAQVYEKQEKRPEALAHWEPCLSHSKLQEEPVDAVWLDTARERMREGPKKGQP